MARAVRLAAIAVALLPGAAAAADSTCHGTVSNGRLEGGVRLTVEGPNFTP